MASALTLRKSRICKIVCPKLPGQLSVYTPSPQTGDAQVQGALFKRGFPFSQSRDLELFEEANSAEVDVGGRGG